LAGQALGHHPISSFANASPSSIEQRKGLTPLTNSPTNSYYLLVVGAGVSKGGIAAPVQVCLYHLCQKPGNLKKPGVLMLGEGVPAYSSPLGEWLQGATPQSISQKKVWPV
jgi:hypothetical protein